MFGKKKRKTAYEILLERGYTEKQALKAIKNNQLGITEAYYGIVQ